MPCVAHVRWYGIGMNSEKLTHFFFFLFFFAWNFVRSDCTAQFFFFVDAAIFVKRLIFVLERFYVCFWIWFQFELKARNTMNWNAIHLEVFMANFAFADGKISFHSIDQIVVWISFGRRKRSIHHLTLIRAFVLLFLFLFSLKKINHFCMNAILFTCDFKWFCMPFHL